MKKSKTILCPSCHRKVGTYDGRSTMNHVVKCKNCKKRVIYHWDTGIIEIKPLPERTCGSGLTFV